MRFLHSLIPLLLLLGAGVADAAASWGFDEAVLTVGKEFKDKLSDRAPLVKPVTLNSTESLKIVLTATENGKAKRPHQAFLLLRDQDTGLEATFPFAVKENGKGKVDFAQKDIPIQLLSSTQPLQATLLLASFGSSQGFSSHVFNLDINPDPNAPLSKYEKPLRYGKLEEIHHIFRADPKSGPKIISLLFVLAIVATVPILLGAWVYLGANLDHLSKAVGAAPISHSIFFGSVLAMEGIFYLYYYNWTLFQMLPAAASVGLLAFLSGSKALSEVQSRRLAGER